MAEHIFTGFGFGPIQGGLFVKEAFQSGNFRRIVVAEIDEIIVDAVRANNGSYYVNVAKADGIEVLKIDNIELLNPGCENDRKILLDALDESTEITTTLPSVNFYDRSSVAGMPGAPQTQKKSVWRSPASLIADGLKSSKAKTTIIYTAENNNQAAEILEKAVARRTGSLPSKRVQFLNTVIGKMSRVVADPNEIEARCEGSRSLRKQGCFRSEIAKPRLSTIAPAIKQAFLVEEFNRILVSQTSRCLQQAGFKPGIEVFIEKDDLLPFEEAKLYGHNAVHALLGFLGAVKGYTRMTELAKYQPIMQIGRKAFLAECGAALIKKYAHLRDELFTEVGFRNYADDLLERMTNPYLADTIARAARDAVRKLGLGDRIFGTMAMALEYGIEPNNMALGAIAGIAVLLEKAEENNLPTNLRLGDWRKLGNAEIEKIIRWIWNNQTGRYAQQLIKYVQDAQKNLATFI